MFKTPNVQAIELHDCEEVERHAEGAPLAPACVIVVSEYYYQICNDYARTEHHMARHPKANIHTAWLHIICIDKVERQKENDGRLYETVQQVKSKQSKRKTGVVDTDFVQFRIAHKVLDL